MKQNRILSTPSRPLEFGRKRNPNFKSRKYFIHRWLRTIQRRTKGNQIQRPGDWNNLWGRTWQTFWQTEIKK